MEKVTCEQIWRKGRSEQFRYGDNREGRAKAPMREHAQHVLGAARRPVRLEQEQQEMKS